MPPEFLQWPVLFPSKKRISTALSGGEHNRKLSVYIFYIKKNVTSLYNIAH